MEDAARLLPAEAGGAPDEPSHYFKKLDSKLGQACRSAFSIAPQVLVFTEAVIGVERKPPLVEQTGVPSFVLTDVWRPRRSV